MFPKQAGVVLTFGVILLVALTTVIIAYVCLVSSDTKHTGYQVGDSQALYLAEAGLQKAIWRLKYDANWRGVGETETLSPGKSYTITVVEDRDFIGTVSQGFSATASSNSVGHEPTLVIDNNMSTYWESRRNIPIGGKQIVEEWIYITFPSVVSIDRARFRLDPAYSKQRPADYIWSVRRQTGGWQDVFSATGNTEVDVTDVFGMQTDIKYLRLLVTKAGNSTQRVVVAEIESPYLHIESQGTVQYLPNNLTKTVVQDILVTSGTPITRIDYTWQEQ